MGVYVLSELTHGLAGLNVYKGIARVMCGNGDKKIPFAEIVIHAMVLAIYFAIIGRTVIKGGSQNQFHVLIFLRPMYLHVVAIVDQIMWLAS